MVFWWDDDAIFDVEVEVAPLSLGCNPPWGGVVEYEGEEESV